MAAQGLRLRQYKLHLLEDIDALKSKEKVQDKSLSSETDYQQQQHDEYEYEKEMDKERMRVLELEVETLGHAMELLMSGQSMLDDSNSQCAFKVRVTLILLTYCKMQNISP